MAQQICNHGTAANIFVLQPRLFLTKNIEYLFNIVLGQDGIICDDVGWWSGLNKGGKIIEDVEIGFCNIVEGTETNN